MLRLTIVSPGEPERSVVVDGWSRVLLGRRLAPDEKPTPSLDRAHVEIGDTALEVVHAGIELRADAWLVYNLAERSGTTLNGEPIETIRALHDGDAIGLGGTTVRVSLETDAPSNRTAEEAPALAVRVLLDALADQSFSDDGMAPILAAAGVTREQVVAMLGRVHTARVHGSEEEADLLFRREMARLTGLEGLEAFTFEELQHVDPEAVATKLGLTHDELAAKFGVEPTSHVHVTSASELAALAGRSVIDGVLLLGPLHLENVHALSSLTRVGELALNNVSGLEGLFLPNLREATNVLIKGCPDLVRIDLTSLQHARNILIQHSHSLTSVLLDGLERVDERFDIFSCGAIEQVYCPKLAIVGDKLQLSKSRIRYLDLPALGRIGGGLHLLVLDGLEDLVLPSLGEIGGQLGLRELADLSTLELPALERVHHDFTLADCPRLVSLTAPNLSAIDGQLGLSKADGLRDLTLEALVEVGGRLTIGLLSSLRSLSLPALESVSDSLALNGLPALTGLALPALTRVGRLGLRSLPSLPAQVTRDLVAQLREAGFEGDIAVDEP